MELEKGTEFNFETLLKESPKLIATFNASWCGKCRLLKPRIKSVARATESNVKFVEVSLEENPGLRKLFGIKYLPVTMSFENGLLKRTTHSIETDQLDILVKELAGFSLSEN